MNAATSPMPMRVAAHFLEIGLNTLPCLASHPSVIYPPVRALLYHPFLQVSLILALCAIRIVGGYRRIEDGLRYPDASYYSICFIYISLIIRSAM